LFYVVGSAFDFGVAAGERRVTETVTETVEEPIIEFVEELGEEVQVGVRTVTRTHRTTKNIPADPSEQLRALIITAITNGVITHDYEDATSVRDAQSNFFDGPFKIQIADGEYKSISETKLLTQVTTVQSAVAEVERQREAGDAAKLTEAERDLAAAETAAVELNTLITAVQSSLSRNFPNAESTGAYLDLLSDLKSSFSPGTALPGYYRYYSASHPDAEQQGQAEIDATEAGGTQSGGVTQLEEPERVFGFTVTAGEGVEVTDPRRGGGVLVTAGLPIMQLGTEESAPTPTSKIQTIAFAKHSVLKSSIKLGESGVKQLNFSKMAIGRPALRSLEQQLAQLTYDASTTVDALFGDFYRERTGENVTTENYTLADAASNLSVQGRVHITTFEEALSSLRAGVPRTPDAAIGGEDEDESVVRQNVIQIARHLTSTLGEDAAKILAQAAEDVIEVYGYRGQRPQGNTTAEEKERAFCELDVVWERLKYALAPGEVTNDEGGDPVKAVVSLDVDKPFFSPVFPVSDERGYEVIGSYRYGRGLSIEAGGSFEHLLDDVRGLTFEDLSPSEVEAIVTAVQEGGNVAKIVGELDPEKQATILAGIELPKEDKTAADYLKGGPGQDAFNSAFRARLASTQDWMQKQTVVNAAWTLADIQNTLRDDICNCKGAEADILLLAFNAENFVDLGQPDDVSNYAANVIRDKELPHKAGEDAVRGVVLDQNSLGLAEAIGGVSKAFDGGVITIAGSDEEG
jgi:hypothetical protein